jgi:hypothetical protein
MVWFHHGNPAIRFKLSLLRIISSNPTKEGLIKDDFRNRREVQLYMLRYTQRLHF